MTLCHQNFVVSRGLALRPVKSEKEEIKWSNLSQNASTTQNITIVKAVDNPSTAGQVEIGDTVKSVFFEFNIAAEAITTAKVLDWIIEKKPGLATGSDPSIVDAVNKKQILKRGMEMLPKDVSTVFKRVFVLRIPPRLRRFGDQDELNYRYKASSAELVNNCGIAIFRHFG